MGSHGSQSLKRYWSRFEVMAKQDQDEEAFNFPIPTQLPPLDFSTSIGYSTTLDFQNNDLSMQESLFDALPLMEESFPTDLPLCSALDLVPSPTTIIQEDLSFGYGNEFGVWNLEMSSSNTGGIDPHIEPLLLVCDSSNGESTTPDERPVKYQKKAKRCREEKTTSSKTLSRNTISQYFYMPITQAAKELNVGLTLLKKRCRELGIRRWPHRKLMSLQTLIKNVQEMGKEGEEGAEGRLREAIEILEQERKLMEEVPDLQLEDKTKRLRQACFKANYKKRKLMMGITRQSHFSSSTNHATSTADADHYGIWEDDDGDEDEMDALLSNCFSSSNEMY